MGKDFTHVAILTGYFLLGVGVAGAFFVPSSRIWGKRHTFIFGTIVLIVSSVWGGVVGKDKDYDSFLWSRIIQGVGCAPFEALVNAAVGDLYFVHQRGIRMAFTNMAVFGGAFFTPILVGKITHTLMWWWTFYLVAIFCAACLPAIIFLCPETAYTRDTNLNTDMLAQDGTTPGNKATGQPSSINNSDGGREDNRDPEKHAIGDVSSNGSAVVPAKISYWKSLSPFNGRKTDEALWKLVLRPFPLFFQPAFLWACLIQGVLIGWTVFIGVILGVYFIGYPLWWDEVKTGYAYVGPFVGAVLGFIISGLTADWSAKVMTKWNNGVYEPEFRIVLVIPMFIFGVMGVFGWGITVDGLLESKWSYAVPLTFFGFEVCGMVIGAVASSLYIVDAYRKFGPISFFIHYVNGHDILTQIQTGDLAIEGFTCMIIFKNLFSFGLTYKAYEWLVVNSTRATPVFNALGAVQVVVCMLSVPMCKSPLSYMARLNIPLIHVCRYIWQAEPQLLLS